MSMQRPPAARPEGLRERKRRATENAIELAAVELALEKGLAEVTVAEICELAKISRSTFFNYMPNRDAAIMGRPIALVPRELAFALLDDADGNVPLGLLRITVASIGHNGVNAPVAAGRRRLVSEQPDAARLQHATLGELRTALLELTVEWLGARPEGRALPDIAVQREALLLVGIAGTAAEVLIEEWANADGELQISEQSFHTAIAELGAVLHRG
ncbi:TetR family transcriptional regulator [Microterricola gilva]|uniref:TetR family transcriptional regulator n=1 Tax=Microterricola gilva TaxID=393267 RepID=A0A4Q8AP19_9MICO|nr:TetR/AcrR family transcriptional regulator [Microterricola gilva]RZU66422.1 TetR family transcriptional regulator [Microterricola gilva]